MLMCSQGTHESRALARFRHHKCWCFPSSRCRGCCRADQPTRPALQLFLLLFVRATAAFVYCRPVSASLLLSLPVRFELSPYLLAVLFRLVDGPVRSFRHAAVLYRLIAVRDAVPSIHAGPSSLSDDACLRYEIKKSAGVGAPTQDPPAA